MSWYVLRCREGQEEHLIKSLHDRLDKEHLTDAFTFTYERMKKYHGEWHKESRNMYPNYVFLESSESKPLFEGLEQFKCVADILENGKLLLPVAASEELFLRKLCGVNHHLGMSKGFLSETDVCITDGLLKGNEQWIKKIDLHKRVAKLHSPALKSGTSEVLPLREIWAGLELEEIC